MIDQATWLTRGWGDVAGCDRMGGIKDDPRRGESAGSMIGLNRRRDTMILHYAPLPAYPLVSA